MSNPEDYEMMIQSEYQQLFGEAVGRAAEEYLLELAVQRSFTDTLEFPRLPQPLGLANIAR
jgi:hypothetical protein